MEQENDLEFDDAPGSPVPNRTARYAQMWREVKKGVPGAVVNALGDVARGSEPYLDTDPIWIFLVAMGWVEGHAMGVEPFRGHHPLDPRSKATEQQLARLVGAKPRERARKAHEEFRRDVKGAVQRTEPLVKAASQLATVLCGELVLAFRLFALGEYEDAKKRRRDAVARWNKLCDKFIDTPSSLPRLCEHCGKPLLFVAKERLEGGALAPAKVHKQCKSAFRAASHRSGRR
jgi:hypothetical protein